MLGFSLQLFLSVAKTNIRYFPNCYWNIYGPFPISLFGFSVWSQHLIQAFVTWLTPTIISCYASHWLEWAAVYFPTPTLLSLQSDYAIRHRQWITVIVLIWPNCQQRLTLSRDVVLNSVWTCGYKVLRGFRGLKLGKGSFQSIKSHLKFWVWLL